MCEDYVMLPFKGLYWYGSWEPGRLRRHVYPVPDPRNPFLGVHLTLTRPAAPRSARRPFLRFGARTTAGCEAFELTRCGSR
jgi:L-2-hydroxyglutarate oxidase LhgO